MAQLNIDEKWWSDPRRLSLADEIGDLVADGLMTRVWRLAQEYWHHHDQALIPKPIFERLPHHQLLVKHRLVSRKRSFYYVKGSKEYFEWLVRSKSDGAKGGKSKGKKSTLGFTDGNPIPIPIPIPTTITIPSPIPIPKPVAEKTVLGLVEDLFPNRTKEESGERIEGPNPFGAPQRSQEQIAEEARLAAVIQEQRRKHGVH